MKKLIIGLGSGLLVAVFLFPATIQAQTTAEQLQQFINSLQEQVLQLRSQLNSAQGVATSTPYILTVAKSGTGSGTVTGPGINCGTDCSEGFASGTQVNLWASVAAGSVFGGWGGCSIASGTVCTVLMNVNKTVTATFNATNNPPYITNVTGPSMLLVNTNGTWTITATDQDGNLNLLTVSWGDNTSSTRAVSGASTTQSFNHSYSTVGLKTITFRVYDTSGLSDTETVTVNVRSVTPTYSKIPVEGSLIKSAQQQLSEMTAKIYEIVRQLGL